MNKRYLVFTIMALLLAGIMLFPSSSAQAGTAQYSDTNVGGPEWVRPFADGTCCSGLGPVRYQATAICVDLAGTYSFSSAQDGWDGYLFVYAGSFDPANQTANFVAGDDDGDGGIGTSDLDATLDAEVPYIVVTTGFELGEEGTFTNTITGDGNVLIGGCDEGEPPLPPPPPPAPVTGCTLSLPAGSVVGDAPFETQVYYEPGNVSPGLFLNPGTYIVLGQDESESYYKVMLACTFVWVRKDSMQPSYAPPQNGEALPVQILSESAEK